MWSLTKTKRVGVCHLGLEDANGTRKAATSVTEAAVLSSVNYGIEDTTIQINKVMKLTCFIHGLGCPFGRFPRPSRGEILQCNLSFSIFCQFFMTFVEL